MRFKASIQNITTFTKLTASLASLGPIAWVRLNETEVRFTVIPEQGTQVWAVLSINAIFDDQYSIQSAADNVINLEVPLNSLQRALKSASQATAAHIRLTKKDGLPLLALTITTSTLSSTPHPTWGTARQQTGFDESESTIGEFGGGRERETVVTQEIPVRVLSPHQVDGLHEPRCREPDVHIMLPSLLQLKGISDRFTRLASGAKAVAAPKLEMAANMHGCLRLRINTDAMNISSVWTGLSNPELDPSQVEGGEEGVLEHPSTKMKRLGSADGKTEEGWAKVRIDGKDWGKVMSVGRLGGRVIACFCDDHALILYVYLSAEEEEGRDESVLTVSSPFNLRGVAC
ncbi:Hus1-like protein [Pseudovirgaria hyperparasitica]|uniref:Checkpoint protein n=1 Tax=Pseudovirgaria hyperparasitica TaxID=470096 RepID=A0A6A6VZA7_9PEZI|nr:Hus1-like protein [Pseudovirgaria hyperparasitica]KAF2755084.1 Hus1-like protein [Pseudovirgaria hyperparasitica]